MTLIRTLACALLLGGVLPTAFAGPPPAPEAPLRAVLLDSITAPLADRGRPAERALAVDVDVRGRVYVLENATARVRVHAPDGRFEEEIGGFGLHPGSLVGPTDLSVSGLEIWVADAQAGAVLRYDDRLAPIETWRSTLDRGREQPFDRPVSVARSPSGDIVVLERDRAEALLLDASGRLVDRVASFGDLGGSLVAPRRVAMAPDGNVAIADPGRGEVLVLDAFGSFARRLPFPGAAGPSGVAWDRGGRLWAAGGEGVVRYDGAHARRLVVADASGDSVPLAGAADLVLRADRLYIARGSAVLVARLKPEDASR